MWDLMMSVLFSSILFVIFKLYSVYRIQTLYAIITNYFTAALVSTLFYTNGVTSRGITAKPWFWGTLALGILFILVFNVIAKTAQQLGVSVASVATKMSFVIPVVFGVLIYNEELAPVKIVGIFLAMAAVYFSSIKKQKMAIDKMAFILPVLAFLGSGLIDVGIGYFQEQHMEVSDFPLFSTIVFLAAGSTGIVFILLRSIGTPLRSNFRNLLAGIVLGIPNYFTVHFLLRALKSETLNSATVFTVNNVAVVLLSTLLGIALFKERLSPKNWSGIVLSVVSILLVLLF